MDDLSNFEAAITNALSEVGCDSYSVADLKRDARECRDEIYADCVACGADIGAPFVNFVISSGVAVFMVFSDPFAVYVARYSENALIASASLLTMSDVDAHLELIRESFGKSIPDASVGRSAAELWLG